MIKIWGVWGIGMFLAAQSWGADRIPYVLQKPEGSVAPTAVAMVTHGLNTKPEKMDTITGSLRSQGMWVFRISLTGHTGGDISEYANATREAWLEDVRKTYREARRLADENHVRLFYVGHSLGGLIAEDFMNTDSDVRIDRLVLFAPAIAVRPTSYLAKILFIFNKDLRFPSTSPEAIRANNGTPVGAYRALFDTIDHFRASSMEGSHVPTLILIDPKDELVSLQSIRRLRSEHDLSEWRILTIDHPELSPGQYHHMIFDEPSLGYAEWTRVERLMLAFLSRKPVGGN